MRVLELGSGHGYNSCFIAKHYGVEIYAVDVCENPSDVLKVAEEKGVAEQVVPLRCDARNLPFAEGFFDAVYSLNAYFYFGTEDTYLPYLSRFLKPGALICVTSPCFAHEPNENTPDYFKFDAPDYLEFYTMHSPAWWYKHFAKCKDIEVQHCEEHPLGREIWMDSMRWQLQCRPLEDIMSNLKMLLMDDEGFVTYFSLLAKKRGKEL